MVPAAILVIIALIIIATLVIGNYFKFREVDERLDEIEQVLQAAVDELARLKGQPIPTGTKPIT